MSAYRAARVVGEVDLGQSHVNDQHFHAHNAALIAGLVLGYNGRLRFPCTLEGEEGEYYSREKRALPSLLLVCITSKNTVFQAVSTIAADM